jgi:hypothetical protein
LRVPFQRYIWSTLQPDTIRINSASSLCGQRIDAHGRTTWIADAHRDGKRFIVHADEVLTAFLEFASVIRGLQRINFNALRFSTKSASVSGLEQAGGHRPVRSFALSGRLQTQSSRQVKRKEDPHESTDLA